MTHPHSVMEWHPDCEACAADGDPTKHAATGVATPTKMPRGKLPKLAAETGRPIPVGLVAFDEIPAELVNDPTSEGEA
jgi:hypothetical protein